MVEYARTLDRYTRGSYQGLETPERQPKPQPLHLSKFCLSRYHARLLKESSRHNYMQDAWGSENYLVLFRQNAQTPPSNYGPNLSISSSRSDRPACPLAGL